MTSWSDTTNERGEIMSGIHAYGAKLKLKIGLTLEEVAQLTNIDVSGITADILDMSTHSTEWRDKKGGLKDSGEISVEGNFTKEGMTLLLDALDEKTVLVDCVIEFPTEENAKAEFDCLVTSVEVGAPHDDKISISATMAISGTIVFTEDE